MNGYYDDNVDDVDDEEEEHDDNDDENRVKIYAFSTSFNNIKANFVAKIMQSAYLCVIYHVKHRNRHFLRFKPDFQFSVKSKVAAFVVTIVGVVTGPQQRHHP